MTGLSPIKVDCIQSLWAVISAALHKFKQAVCVPASLRRVAFEFKVVCCARCSESLRRRVWSCLRHSILRVQCTHDARLHIKVRLIAWPSRKQARGWETQMTRSLKRSRILRTRDAWQLNSARLRYLIKMELCWSTFYISDEMWVSDCLNIPSVAESSPCFSSLSGSTCNSQLFINNSY